MSFVSGILLLIGAAMGAHDPLRPLAPLTVARAAAPVEGQMVQLAHKGDWNAVKSVMDVQQQITGTTKPVILDLYADWCISCKVMERNVFPEPEVAQLLSQFHLLRADVTLNDETDQALLNNYGLFGPPSFVFFNVDGSEIQEVRLQGELDSDGFARHLQTVIDVWKSRNVGEIAANF